MGSRKAILSKRLVKIACANAGTSVRQAILRAGISEGYGYKIQNSDRSSLAQINRLAAALGVSALDLIELTPARCAEGRGDRGDQTGEDDAGALDDLDLDLDAMRLPVFAA